METIIGLKELREHTQQYIDAARRGKSFIVIRKTTPVFKITPLNEGSGEWEEVADFTKIKKGGVDMKEILARL
ncbi:hypothetical protein HY250_04860 [Candidatus Azambacteria bacterium]|nr:hypothetical protein [Candidatus Azambacteria bacterium]MBI3685709.1 hypothetical protein [Candidatus Azambacteria bacterium]